MENYSAMMLGIPETAKAFGISQHYARQLALQGMVKAVRIGKGKILINQKSVEEYFDSAYLYEKQEGGAKK